MSKNLKVEISQITFDNLESIASIHGEAFKDSALTRLGILPTKKYYESLLFKSTDNCNLGAFSDQQLRGFCFSGNYSGSLSQFLTKNKEFLFRWILFHPWLIFDKTILNKILVSINIIKKTYRPPQHPPIKKKSFGILAIAVDPKYQKMGIGRHLLSEVESRAEKLGYEYMHLTVHPENLPSIEFYEKNGFVRRKKEKEEWAGLMEKEIQKETVNKS
jgi:ribosomal protein S18 acetylase RimI-like enzyme